MNDSTSPPKRYSEETLRKMKRPQLMQMAKAQGLYTEYVSLFPADGGLPSNASNDVLVASMLRMYRIAYGEEPDPRPPRPAASAAAAAPAETDPAQPADESDAAIYIRKNFLIHPRHLEILEDFSYRVRKKTGLRLNHSQIVRALLEQVEHVDPGRVFRPEDVAEEIKRLPKSTLF